MVGGGRDLMIYLLTPDICSSHSDVGWSLRLDPQVWNTITRGGCIPTNCSLSKSNPFVSTCYVHVIGKQPRVRPIQLCDGTFLLTVWEYSPGPQTHRIERFELSAGQMTTCMDIDITKDQSVC